MVVLAASALGIAGIALVVLAVLVLLVSLLHPEGLKRPGGYLDGQEPQRRDERDERGA
jgi:hypothetical protein